MTQARFPDYEHVANAITTDPEGKSQKIELKTGLNYCNLGFVVNGQTGRMIFDSDTRRVTLIDAGNVKTTYRKKLLDNKVIELGIPPVPSIRIEFTGPQGRKVTICGISH